jgi:ABC-2 type transport system ATP-binding protein
MNIIVNNLYKKYLNFELNLPILKINSGDIFGLVGNNGAGKTTFLRLCLDLIEAKKGEVFSGELNVAKNEDWKNYTGAYLDQGFLIDFLTPEEYFDFVASLHKMTKEQIRNSLDRFEAFFNGNILDKGKYIRELSTGNKNKVGITAAMIFNPKVLLLDEPFANLDPTSRQILSNLLIQMNREYGTTMIISSHDLDNVVDVCTRIAILENGKIVGDNEKTETTYDNLKRYFEVKVRD